MNVKEESSEESDSSIEMPRPKKRMKVKKEDPDWEDEKPKAKRVVKTEATDDKPKRGRKPKAEKSEEKPKASRKPKADASSKPARTAKSSQDVKPKMGGTFQTKLEENDTKPKNEGALKRKVEEDVKKNVKKLKSGALNGEPDFEGSAKPSTSKDSLQKEAFIVAKNMNCSVSKAETLIQMMSDGATVPFLIR